MLLLSLHFSFHLANCFCMVSFFCTGKLQFHYNSCRDGFICHSVAVVVNAMPNRNHTQYAHLQHLNDSHTFIQCIASYDSSLLLLCSSYIIIAFKDVWHISKKAEKKERKKESNWKSCTIAWLPTTNDYLFEYLVLNFIISSFF